MGYSISGELDPTTLALETIDSGHHEVHEGDAFFYAASPALLSGATKDYILVTPNTTKWAHSGFTLQFNDGSGSLSLFEATDRVGTTLQTTYNRNRNSAKLAAVTIYADQTGGTTDGTLLFVFRMGSAGAPAGNASGSTQEIILKQNTKYLFRLTNLTSAPNNVALILSWYEHTSKTS